jgi:hypothetical protein
MEIQRIIGGKAYTIELSDEELFEAYLEKNHEFNLMNVIRYLDYVEEVGGIPSELLKSRRFADRVLIQLEQMQDNYEVNMSQAANAAIEYEIKSETIEDLVSASTADLIVDRLNKVGYNLGENREKLAVILREKPDSIIRSINELPTTQSAQKWQKSASDSCISLVKKYKSFAYTGRAINELEDYDDLIPESEREKNKPQERERPLAKGLSRTRERSRW